jgi:ubiquinone/menaquinone biosynthesis C-methylase UbiE
MREPLLRFTEIAVPATQGRLHDEQSRQQKARKIVTILQDALGRDLHGLRCLDVGCAAGLISYHLGAECGQVWALDPDAVSLRQGPQRDNLGFILGDAMRLPFAAASFEVVVCAQVYEHVPDAMQLMAEVRRVLTNKGVCFFSGPNKWSVIEYHHGLPFLSWLPSRLAALYLRLTGRGSCYAERPLSYRRLQRLLQGFSIQDYTIDMLIDPDRFHCRDEVPLARVVRHVPRWVWRVLYAILPNYNWVLRKREQL